jgi:hypothetical protein
MRCNQSELPAVAASPATYSGSSEPATHSGSSVQQAVCADIEAESVTSFEDFSIMKIAMRKKQFTVGTTYFTIVNGLKTEKKSRVFWVCTKCSVHFSAKKSVNGEEWVVSRKEHDQECPNSKRLETSHDMQDDSFGGGATILSHSYELDSYKGLKLCIEGMGASGIIRADQIADQIRFTFPGVTVTKELISRLARKAHDLFFGKGVSDVLLLQEMSKYWEERGGSFTLVYGRDLGKIGIDAEKMIGIIWIAPFAHLLVDAYGDLFVTDGTHGMSQYGWRSMPIAVCNSFDNPHPPMVVMATSENADILCLGIRYLHKHLESKGIEFLPFAQECDLSQPKGDASIGSTDDILHENYMCPPEWRAFVASAIRKGSEGCKR